MSQNDNLPIEAIRFLDAIEPVLAGYTSAGFSYVALKSNGVYQLSQGRLYLSPLPNHATCWEIRTEIVSAGLVDVAPQRKAIESFLRACLSGSIVTKSGEIDFRPPEKRLHEVHFSPLYYELERSGIRERRLEIRGDRRVRSIDVDLDWDLRAMNPPFLGVQDLCEGLGLWPLRGDSSAIEIIAPSVVFVDSKSRVNAGTLDFECELASGLDSNEVSVGFRVFQGQEVPKTIRVTGIELSWAAAADRLIGKKSIPIGEGAFVHCSACYRGVAFHCRLISDPAFTSNPRSAAIQPFDPELKVLRETLLTPQGNGQNTRNFEQAVAQMMWLLGLSPCNLNVSKRTEDAPDVIGFTPSGQAVLVECTTGVVKHEKISKLLQRAAVLRDSLIAAKFSNSKVLPVFVTNVNRSGVESDWEDARKRGVLVLTADEITRLLERIQFLPSPDALFEQGEALVRKQAFEIGHSVPTHLLKAN